MADLTAYTFSREAIARLIEDHERLRQMLRNTAAQVQGVRHETGPATRVRVGVTAVSEQWPNYPDPDTQADTFVVKLQDWSFTEEPGRQVGSQTDRGEYVIARTHRQRYVPVGVPVLVLEVRGAYGVRYFIMDGPERQNVLLFEAVSMRTLTGVTDDLDLVADGDAVSEATCFKVADPAGVSGWSVTGDANSDWLATTNSCNTEYDAPTIELQRSGLYEVHVTFQPRASGAWADDVFEFPETYLTEQFTTAATSGHTHTVDARRLDDLVAIPRGQLQSWDPDLETWSSGVLSAYGRIVYGSQPVASPYNGVYRYYEPTVSTFGAFEWVAGTRLRFLCELMSAPDADAGAWCSQIRVLIRYWGDNVGSALQHFCDVGSGTTTTSTTTTSTTTTSTTTTSTTTTSTTTTSTTTTSTTTTSTTTTSTTTTSTTTSTSTTTTTTSTTSTSSTTGNPVGACCFGFTGICTVLTEADCLAAGGWWNGAGTDCDPNPCPIA